MHFYSHLQILTEMGVTESKWRPFFLAMYQFIFPTIRDARIRPFEPFTKLSVLDASILDELDGPMEAPNTLKHVRLGTNSTRCMTISPIKRPPLPIGIQRPPQAPRDQHHRNLKDIPKPSGRLKKRTLSMVTEGSPKTKRKVSNKTKYFRSMKKDCKYIISYCFMCCHKS